MYASTTGSGGAVKPHPWLKNDNSDSTTNMKKENKKDNKYNEDYENEDYQ